MSIINDVTHSYKGIYTDETYRDYNDTDRAIELEDNLTAICNHLAEIHKLTYKKSVNAEYLLTIVASYLLGLQDGSIVYNEMETPAQLFKDSLLPSLANSEEVITEVIEEDYSGEPQSTKDDEGTDT